MVKVENEKKVKKRKQEDDSDYEEREVNIPLCLELCTPSLWLWTVIEVISH